MGLTLICDDMDIKLGTYSFVYEFKIALIKSILSYLNSTDFNDDYCVKDILLEDLNNLIEDDKININKLKKVKEELFAFYELDGFFNFLTNCSCDGIYATCETTKFLKTLKIVEEHVDTNFKICIERAKTIFEYSSNTGNDVFCS